MKDDSKNVGHGQLGKSVDNLGHSTFEALAKSLAIILPQQPPDFTVLSTDIPPHNVIERLSF